MYNVDIDTNTGITRLTVHADKSFIFRLGIDTETNIDVDIRNRCTYSTQL